MNTAVTIITPAGPVAFTGQETPEQRQATLAKAYGAPVAARAAPGVQFHTDDTMRHLERLALEQQGHKAAPPSQLPSKPVDPDKLPAFDKEMRDKGVAKPIPAEEAAKEEKFQADSIAWLEAFANNQDDAWQKENLPRLEAMVQELRTGKVEFYLDDLSRPRTRLRPGVAAVPAAQPRDASGKFAPGVEAAADIAAKATNKYGYAPASAITGPLLHGYTLPHGPDREWNVAELIAGLRLARIGNVSQAQLEAMLQG